MTPLGATINMLERLRAVYKQPALMCSFGKDSMVLLDILRRIGWKMPVVHFKDPWFPCKNTFANQVTELMGLVVHDWSPSNVSLCDTGVSPSYVNHYQVGSEQLARGTNILPPVDGEDWACGLHDVLLRPKGTFMAPWDALLVGHKSSDVDQNAGRIPLKVDVLSGGGTTADVAFPLRHWTDADVWEHTRLYDVPQQTTRYDVQTGTELEDKKYNPDYARVCIECVDRRKLGQPVECKRVGATITNIADRVQYHDLRRQYSSEE
jgi:3'-phosphoadenosine 5'-phosphosulfate sulfotransferase (PAPS reductase)/FAD synthetase